MTGLTRRAMLAGAGACLALGSSVVGLDEAARAEERLVGDRPTRTGRARRMVQPDAVFGIRTMEPYVGLTFDDGPDPDFTPHVLDVLDRYDARATFFVVGVNALAWPDLLAEVQRRGHTIGNHTHDHVELQDLGVTAVAAELRGAARDLARVGVAPPTWFRPPKGYTSTNVARVARHERLRTAYWTHCVEANHPAGVSVAGAMHRMASTVSAGSIVLAHDGGRVMAPGGQRLDRSRTVEALPHLLERLRSDGWIPVDLPTLVRSGPPR